ncbi:hypothetical protein CHLRE_09g389500v5 [Chlamydomonas reinhardtii]|uniref:Uncharacterized protein n=1 Tax=Chlamydomonas reinhardtii TaxID=3055 RepID=A0A2K3DDK4_CHLRE|nr:uncharacterized protein CHLRE_09g389500v5 [Chlamydomonas reinhardtii]PNW78622.1 hypothetical protein CHLRE_09g389500v5 [Chlamydomonas reinhardtii]
MYSLSYVDRIKLLSLTAASGEVANLQVALEVVRCAPTVKVISAAAAAGKLAAVQYLHEHARCPWGADTTAAAAEASQLDTLKWLQGAGCPLDTTALQAAAKAGGAAAVDWLLAETPVISGLSPREAADSLEAAACVAAAAGHINLFESLFAGLVPALETAPPRATRGRGRGGPALQVGAAEPPPLRGPDGSTLARILEALAEGADADTLQSFVRTWVDDVEPDPRRQLDERQLNQAIIAAAGSTTPGWQAKVDFLLQRKLQQQQQAAQQQAAQPQPPQAVQQQQAAPRTLLLLNRAILAPDVATRVPWLCSPERPVQLAVSMDDLNKLLEQGQWEVAQKLVAEVPGLTYNYASTRAAIKGGHMDIVQALLAAPHNCRILGPEALKVLASAGRLEGVRWLVEEFAEKGGQDSETANSWKIALTSEVFADALTSGSLPLLRWLLAKGWSAEDPPAGAPKRRKDPVASVEEAWVSAADLGNEEIMEWLASEAQVPFLADGEPYVRAAKRADQLMLDCLKRVGCPLPAEALTGALAWGVPLPILRWLVDQGCPVDWPDALAAARLRLRPPGALEWLEELQRQKQADALSPAAEAGASVQADKVPPWLILGTHAGGAGGAASAGASGTEKGEGAVDIEPVSYEDADHIVVVVDNGGRPFTVRISVPRGVATVCITNSDNVEDHATWDPRTTGSVFKSYKFEKLWIGLDPAERTEAALEKEEEWRVLDKEARREGRPSAKKEVWYYGGSSVLIGLGGCKYIFVGMEAYSFTTEDDEIRDYVSTMGNSAVPYPYAVGAQNCYYMIEDTYIPWHIIRRTRPQDREDPYHVLYSNELHGWLPGRDPTAPGPPTQRSEWQAKYMLANKQLVHARIW